MFDKLVSVYDAWSKGGRALDLEQLAMEEGFHFSRREPLGQQLSQIKGFDLISKKGTKRLLGILESELHNGSGIVRAYDFLRTQDLETYTTSVVEIYIDHFRTDKFKIQPKGFLGGTTSLFMRKKKPFPEVKQFYKNFIIKSESDHLEEVLNPSSLDLLVSRPKLTVEGDGAFFLFYQKNKMIPVLDIMPLVDFAEDFVGVLQRGGEGGYV